jgi:hypothetical protein
MEKRRLVKAVVVVVAVSASVALALPPMGPPMATLKQGQFSAGFEYGYSDMDLEVDVKQSLTAPGVDVSAKESGPLDDFKSNMLFGRLGYGVTDNWEVFMRLGVADVEMEDWFDGSYGFAWGLGAKATLLKQDSLTWGGLLQVTWFNPGDDKLTDIVSVPAGEGEADVTISGNGEVDWWEIQIAVGPTWQRDGFCIYGGPFLHFLNGDYDEKLTGTLTNPGDVVSRLTADIEEDSALGGYVGAQWDIGKWINNASWNAELQFTGDAWAFGTGVIWRLP